MKTDMSTPTSTTILTPGLTRGWRIALILLFSALLLAGICNGYRICAYGLNFSDEPYHIINALDYKNAPMTFLTALIGNVTGSVFGWEYINFRYLAWTFDLLSIIIAGFFLFWRTKSIVISLGFTSSLLIFESISRRVFSLYGWDSLVGLTLTIITGLMLFYLSNRSTFLLVMISILCGLAVLIKITNIALLPVVGLYLFLYKRSIKSVLVFSVIFLLVAAVGVLLGYDNFDNFISYIRINSNSEHGSIIGLIKQSIFGLFLIFPFVSWYLCQYYFINKITALGGWLKIGLIVGLILANFMVLYVFCISFNVDEVCFFVSVALSTIVVSLSKNKYIVSFICVMGFMPILGSNTGIVKFLTIPSILFTCGYLITKDNYFRVVSSAFVLIISFILFKFYKSRVETFFDSGMPYLTSRVSTLDKLSGIYTTRENVKKIEDIIQLTGGRTTFVVGDSIDKYLYEYLFNNINQYYRQAFSKKNGYSKQWYIDSISDHVSQAPKGMQYLYLSSDTTTNMYEMLSSRMPQVGSTDKAILFTKQ